MNTPKSALLAAVKRRARFSMVLFSLTLSPTRRQEIPFSLRTSFCGSMTTRAVSFLLNCMRLLLFLHRFDHRGNARVRLRFQEVQQIFVDPVLVRRA